MTLTDSLRVSWTSIALGCEQDFGVLSSFGMRERWRM
jgi:hypothetical protein